MSHQTSRAIWIAVVVCALINAGCASDSPTDKPYKIEHRYAVDDPMFARTMGNLFGPPLVPGNSIQTLQNGDEIFPEMLGAIRSAERSITFETFVYWSGEIGRAFSDAFVERAKAGVRVHVIIDSIGADRIDRDYIKAMKAAGVKIVDYHPLHWWDLSAHKKLNNRTHRKILVVDGRVGFTGGVGIADEWLGAAQDPKHWRDNHYKVTGPIVLQLQSAFVDNWLETTGEVLDGEDYMPDLKNTGEHWAQVFKSSPHGGSESMELMFLLSIASAGKNVRLASAYFVPDRLTVQTLSDAARRGIKVQIIVPGPNIDYKFVRRASRARWGELLESGVEIYEYQPTMYHTKLMIVDDKWTSIGSTNLDNRSFRMNDEANINVLDPAFAKEQIALFEEDLKKSQQITYERWKNRPIQNKLWGGFLSAFGWLM
jgi:cardiolipin synthase